MKKRNVINIHTLIVISSIVLFSLALLACPEISSNKKKHSKQTTKTPDTQNTPNQQSSPQYTFSDTLSKVLYNAAKNKKVPEDAIVDDDTSEAARTIFNALGVQAGNTLSVIHVDDNGNNKNDGTTWTTAKLSIEAALDDISNVSANNPYLVLIGSGTYTPTKTLSMKNHVAIIGGFDTSSNEASGYEKNKKTIISGKHKRQVFYNNNLNTSAVLARVTIRNGKAVKGGGMRNFNSSPTIMHTTFYKNKASQNGGGMYNFNSSPTITHTTFSKNNATNHGGGMYNFNSSPTIMHTTFSGNTASLNSGGMYNENSSPTIMHTMFSQNTASQDGGGMYNVKNSSPTIMHTTFSGNTASQNGGGMYNLYTSSPTIMHTTFYKNKASQNGGGMFNLYKSSPTISSSIFWGNTKNNTPNQIGHENSTPVVAHSIVQGGYTSGTVIITEDPQLQPLANNGGFIETIAITTGSSAIDQGLYGAHKGKTQYYSKDHTNWYTSPTLANNKKTTLPSDAIKYTTDAQGYDYKSRPDIGAFEYYPPTMPSP